MQCVCVCPGEVYLFCKGADSSIFPRVVSGKVEEVKDRVEHNAVVSVNTHTQTHTHIHTNKHTHTKYN